MSISNLVKKSDILKWVLIVCAYICYGILHLLFWPFKIGKNKIVVSNFYGQGYGDNPKYIVEELLKMRKSLDIVWLVSGKGEYKFPKGIRTVKIFSIRSIYEFMTAKIWIDNCRKYFFIIYLRKKIRFIYKHGMVGLL